MNSLPKDIEDIIIDYKYQLEHQDKMKKICKQLKNKKQKPIIYVRYTYYDCYNNATGEIETTTTIEGDREYQNTDVKSMDYLLIYYDNCEVPYYYIREAPFVRESNTNYYPYMRKVWIEDWSI